MQTHPMKYQTPTAKLYIERDHERIQVHCAQAADAQKRRLHRVQPADGRRQKRLGQVCGRYSAIFPVALKIGQLNGFCIGRSERGAQDKPWGIYFIQ